MGPRPDLFEKYTAELRKAGEKRVDKELLRAIAKFWGAEIYRRDFSRIRYTDRAAIESVRKDFLLGKLGLDSADQINEGIAEVKQRYTEHTKYRVVFCYFLAKHFRKRKVLLEM